MVNSGSPVMLPPERGQLIAGGAVHARLLVAHDHPSYASTFEMTVAPGFDVGGARPRQRRGDVLRHRR